MINNKIYIGKHQTKDLEDGYFGSGKHLKRAIKKYGIENFKKEILHIFQTETEMNSKETELVTEEFCLREDTYNICSGGQGGWSYVNREIKTLNRFKKENKFTKECSIKASEKRNVLMLDENYKKSLSKKISDSNKGRLPTFKGKNHLEKTKQKISFSMIGKRKGKLNPQFGKFWITDGFKSQMIKMELDIPEGWFKGRKI